MGVETTFPVNVPLGPVLPVYVLPFVVVVNVSPPVGLAFTAASSVFSRGRCAAGARLIAFSDARSPTRRPSPSRKLKSWP